MKSAKYLVLLALFFAVFCCAVACTSNGIAFSYIDLNGEAQEFQLNEFKEKKLPIIEKPGYEQIGWYLELEGEEVLLDEEAFKKISESGNNNIYVYPKFEKIAYSIEYSNTKGQTNDNPTSYYIDSENISLLPLADFDGLLFDGWYIGSERIEVINTYELKNYSLEAHWIEAYKIEIIGKVGSAVLFDEEKIVKKGESLRFTLPQYLGLDLLTAENSINKTPTSNETIEVNYAIQNRELPIISIDTQNQQQILDKETYITSKISLTNTNETYEFADIDAGVRLRGNSTLSFPKKGYRIKFDKKQSMLGSSYKAKSWTLIANYADKSLSRNFIAYELAEEFEGIAFASMHEWVEVYLNGEYLGVYLLCDQMQTGEGRVDIDESYINEAEGADQYDIGYLLELDSRADSEGQINKDYFVVDGTKYAIKTPDTDSKKYNTLACEYIKSYLEECVAVLEGDDWSAITSYIDVDSFVDTYIIQELFANTDVGFSSFYLYKDKGGKLCAGPVWDFDISAGLTDWRDIDEAVRQNAIDMGNAYAETPNGQLYASVQNAWYKALLNHVEYKTLVKNRLEEKKEKVFEILNQLDPSVNSFLYASMKNAIDLNFEKYQIMDIRIWPNPAVPTSIDTVVGQMEYLRLWLYVRYYYICDCYN